MSLVCVLSPSWDEALYGIFFREGSTTLIKRASRTKILDGLADIGATPSAISVVSALFDYLASSQTMRVVRVSSV